MDLRRVHRYKYTIRLALLVAFVIIPLLVLTVYVWAHLLTGRPVIR